MAVPTTPATYRQLRDEFQKYGSHPLTTHHSHRSSGSKPMSMEQNRFREFAEKYVIARAHLLNTTQDIWNATLDAKQAYRMIIGQTDTLAPPDAPEKAPEKAPDAGAWMSAFEFNKYMVDEDYFWKEMKGASTRGKGSKKGR